MDHRRWRRLPAWSLIALALPCGCAATQRVDVDPRAAAAARYVVGRVEVFRDGQQLAVVKSGFGGAVTGSALVELSLLNSATRERFSIVITDPAGWFGATLPPGNYGVGMRYYIWVFGTPARLVVPDDPQRCYVGTLGVNLFARLSVAGGWAGVAGGAVPSEDNDYRVADQRADVQGFAAAPLPACLMSLEPTPSAARPLPNACERQNAPGPDASVRNRSQSHDDDELPSPAMSCGRTALIDPRRTASARWSISVGSALRMTMRAPTCLAIGTTPAMG
jgi:hypothetical protein